MGERVLVALKVSKSSWEDIARRIRAIGGYEDLFFHSARGEASIGLDGVAIVIDPDTEDGRKAKD